MACMASQSKGGVFFFEFTSGAENGVSRKKFQLFPLKAGPCNPATSLG